MTDEGAQGVNAAVAAEIRAERARQHRKQEDVARAAGVPKRTYVRYESGERKMTPDKMHDIAMALGMTGPALMQAAMEHNPEAFRLLDLPDSDESH